MSDRAVQCRFCTAICTQEESVTITGPREHWWSAPVSYVADIHVCPSCGRSWYINKFTRIEKWVRPPDYQRVSDPVLRERVRTMMMDWNEQVAVLREVQKEEPDLTLLDDELKEACIDIVEGYQHYPNEHQLWIIALLGKYEHTTFRRDIYDIRLACRTRHAMNAYVERVRQAKARLAKNELREKIAKYDALFDEAAL